MSKNEQFTFQVVTEFLNAKLTRREAAELLAITQRSVSRIARRIQRGGSHGVRHANTGKRAHNRTPDALREFVMELVKKRYYDFNMTHALEKLEEEQGLRIGYFTFRKWCLKEGMVKRRKRRRAVARYHRVRMREEGLLLQMDGTPHRFNGRDEWCLIAAIDDATSDIPYGEFFKSEDTVSCMKVLKRIIEIKGRPVAIYVDCAGWFGGLKRQDFSQFKNSCDALDIRVIFAKSAQAKGRVERAWDTFQDRIVPEMRLRNIQSMSCANEYLQNQFLPNYWAKRNTIAARGDVSRYRAVPEGLDLGEVFCLKDFRSVKRNHTLSWNGLLYRLDSPVKYSIQGQKIELRTYGDGSWKAFFADQEIALTPLPAHLQPSPKALKAAA